MLYSTNKLAATTHLLFSARRCFFVSNFRWTTGKIIKRLRPDIGKYGEFLCSQVTTIVLRALFSLSLSLSPELLQPLPRTLAVNARVIETCKKTHMQLRYARLYDPNRFTTAIRTRCNFDMRRNASGKGRKTMNIPGALV